MKAVKHWQRLLLAGAAGLAVVACSDTDIDSPGTITVPPPPPPPPPPPAAAALDFVPAAGCPTGSAEVRLPETVAGAGNTIDVCGLTGTITSNVDIPAGVTIALDGPVFVDNGATISFGAGSRAFGQSGGDYLVISTGADINAVGSATSPVIMTSRADVEATPPRDASSQARGEWGGLIINGLAPINACAAADRGTAACTKLGEGSSGSFGGIEPTDDSGELRYVQVRFAGFEVTPTNELNGIALQGVGTGTDVNFIQVHNNEDDGIEFFGGTARARYVVLTGNSDDSFDWTDGWVGSAQNILVVIDDAGERGVEADNLEGDEDAAPRSNPTLANFTFIGSPTASDADSSGMVIRRGTAGRFVNGIVANWLNAGIDVDSAATFTNAQATVGCSLDPADEDLAFGSIFLDNSDNLESGDAADTADQTTLFGECLNIVQGTNTLVDGFFPGPAEQAVTAVDPNSFDTELAAETYVGAFAPTETLSSNWAAGWTFGLFPAPSCPTNTIATGETLDGKTVCRLSGTLLSDTTLVRGDALIYELSGPVFVGQDSPAAGSDVTLRIDQGVTVFGSTGADYLVVARGNDIESNGTASRPVIMTSRGDVAQTAGRDAETARGEWGGLIINGFAPINACAAADRGTVDCTKLGEGSSGLFGGITTDDDSGNLFYTRVQFAGFEVTPTNELNGIAFQGVGDLTDVDFIQVHNNEDDGVEFFGGTVNASHIVLTGNSDDSFDWTDGWVGAAQFVIVHIDQAGERGIEADNLEGDEDALPRSNPSLSNFTFIGAGALTADGDSSGMVVRRGTAGRFVNGVVVNWLNAGIDVDSAATFTNATATAGCTLTAGTSDMAFGSILLDNTDDLESGDSDSASQTALFAECSDIDTTSANTLTGYSFYAGSTLASPIGVVPGPSETGLTAVDPTTVDPFFVSASYVGAVENAADEWYRGWTFQDAP